MELEELKIKVTNLLITEYEFTPEEADDTVSSSLETDANLWSENSNPEDLAKFLASDENDE